MSAYPAAHVPDAGLPPRDDPTTRGPAEARDTARQGDPQRRAHDDRETRMSKGDLARPPARRTRGPEPEFVQLLTPDGERVSHPDYDVDFTDEELRGLYRDLVDDPQARRRGDRPAAAGRARHLGQPAGAGGGPGRLRPGAADAGHGLPDLPRARRALLPGHRPDHAVGPVPRRRPGRLGPERA